MPFVYQRSDRVGVRYGQGRDQLHDWQRKAAFGLTAKDKWPDQGMPPRVIRTNGLDVQVFVLSKEMAKQAKLTKRCFAVCPHCHRQVEAGHLGQHLGAKHGG